MSDDYETVAPPEGLAADLVRAAGNGALLLQRKDIILDATPYLTRLALSPETRSPGRYGSKGPCTYVHVITASDSDRAYHDHPFDFASYILWGEYVEHVPGRPPKTFRAGDWNVKRSTDLHRLELRRSKFNESAAGAVTVVFRGSRVRDWGFWTPDGGWVDARTWTAKSEVGG